MIPENEICQELPVSDREIIILIDCLTHTQKGLYSTLAANTYALSKEAKDGIMNRLEEIQILIDKLKLT